MSGSGGHRVVITGMGAVTPLGNAVDSFCDALLSGRSGVGPLDRFDPHALPTRIAAQCALPEGAADAPFGDLKVAFAEEAARQAWAQASAAGRPLGEGGISMGVGLELFSMEDLAAQRAGRSPSAADPIEARLSFMQTPSELCVHRIASLYGLRLPPRVHVSACAASTDALGEAFHRVREGRARFMLAGGTDSMINPLGIGGFCLLRAMSTRNEAPERASRPFDLGRDGFVMGEGAGVLVLERLEDARERGAAVLAELRGYGAAFDAHQIADPHPEGRGALAAMRAALTDASLPADAIDAVNAHATGTPKNDPAESRALRELFGARADRVPVSATKSMIGHLISAAGAVEAIAAIACMRRGMVHPTINLEEPDPLCDLDYVREGARPWPQRHLLSCSYGFGGHNAAIVISNAGLIEGLRQEDP